MQNQFQLILKKVLKQVSCIKTHKPDVTFRLEYARKPADAELAVYVKNSELFFEAYFYQYVVSDS